MDYSKLITCDTEVYPNYLLIFFKRVIDGKTLYFEKFNDSDLAIDNIKYILDNHTIVTFNGNKFDQLIVEAAVKGFTNATIYKICCMAIEDNMQPWQIRKQIGFRKMDIDHIDIIEVVPLKASLKIYAGRLHCKELMDLPVPAGSIITKEQLPGIRYYCELDCDDTELIFRKLEGEINLRCEMSEVYGIDLRSKSDAQIAETVIKKSLEEDHNIKSKRPKIPEGTTYNYKPPDNLVFETKVMQDVFRQYCERPFTVGKSGHVEFEFEFVESDRLKSGKRKGEFPDSKKKLKFNLGNTKYTVGMGGLHSNEKSISFTNKKGILRDIDVEAFYPRIILNNKLFPKHLGNTFLEIYGGIVSRRLIAKHNGDKIVNNSLKIVINGSFGKLGSKWSILYSPDLMLQVTVTGQLSLLMLIERLELVGITVVSANTDGVVIDMTKDQEQLANQIIEDWEFDTDYKMEDTEYISLNCRDVNNYIAVKPASPDRDGALQPISNKGKGAYSDQRDSYYCLRSNPVNDICSNAVKAFLETGVKLEDTIYNSVDITEFLTLRTVNGGAIYHGEGIGKAIRWYYGKYELDIIRYKTNGNKVPLSGGAVPLMRLPDQGLPDDLDYEWYIKESYEILKRIGVEH